MNVTNENFNILINDEFSILGLVTFQIKYDNATNSYLTEGILKTHKYIEDIESIECDKFKIAGINVYLEAFGSTDIFNLYYFNFDSYMIKDNEIELSEEELLDIYKKEIEE